METLTETLLRASFQFFDIDSIEIGPRGAVYKFYTKQEISKKLRMKLERRPANAETNKLGCHQNKIEDLVTKLGQYEPIVSNIQYLKLCN